MFVPVHACMHVCVYKTGGEKKFLYFICPAEEWTSPLYKEIIWRKWTWFIKYRLLLIYPSLADWIWTMLWTCWSQDFSGGRDEPGGNLEDDLHLTRTRWRCGRGMLCHCEWHSMPNDRRAQWTEAGWLTERRKWLWRSDEEKIKFDRTLNSRLLDDWVISKTSDLVGCSRSSVASIHQKWSKGGTVVNRQLGNGWLHSRMHMGNKGSPMWSNPTAELM